MSDTNGSAEPPPAEAAAPAPEEAPASADDAEDAEDADEEDHGGLEGERRVAGQVGLRPARRHPRQRQHADIAAAGAHAAAPPPAHRTIDHDRDA